MIVFKGGLEILVVVLFLIWGWTDALPHIQAKQIPQYSQASTYEHSYKRQDVDFTRQLMEAPELVRRNEGECALRDLTNDYYNGLEQEAKKVVASGNTAWDEFMDFCSSHIDKWYQKVEESVDSGDESNCNCYLGIYRGAGPFLIDKEGYRDYLCNMMVTRFGTRFGKTCTDQAMLNCSTIVRQVNTALYDSNQHTLTEDIQTVIDQATDCLTQLMPSQPLWTDECKLMFHVRPGSNIELQHTLWTMTAQQGCSFYIQECRPPFQYLCVLNEADLREAFEDIVDCYNQHNANAIGQCELAEHSQIRESFILQMVTGYQNSCDDYPVLEAFWARTGCTNIPPWRPESLGYTSPDYVEWNKSKQKKSSNDMTGLLNLMKRVLGKTTQN